MRRGGIVPRGGQGFPWTYGPGEPALPVATQFGYPPAVPLYTYGESEHIPFRVVLTGNPYNSWRPRGPWVTGPEGGFPRPASTGGRMPGGQGTDMGDQSTWQRPYRFTP